MKNNFLNKVKNGLIVSCQALEDEPLHSSYIMSRMALAAEKGGAVAIRANSVSDIKAIKEVVKLPIIGLIKKDYPNKDIFITPTMEEIKQLVDLKVEVIALDATMRPQVDNVTLEEKVKYIQSNNILAMADISTLEEGINAEKIGFDIISTTLSGYTNYSKSSNGPDIELVKQLVSKIKTPVFAEGKIFTKEDLEAILNAKPYSVVIGSAITRPQIITKRFNDVINGYNERQKN